MRIGIDTGSTSRIDGALAGIDYEYTWAYDASKQASVSDFANIGNYNGAIVDDGIRLTWSSSQATGIEFLDAEFTSGSYSEDSGGVPDGAVAATSGASVNHPGRYFSVVATWHEFTLASGTLEQPYENQLLTTSGGTFVNIESAADGLGDGPSHINGIGLRPLGTFGSGGGTQEVLNQFVGRPLAFTHDLKNALYSLSPGTDISSITIYPARGKDGVYDMTIHGFIFSNKPPRIYHLPVPINNPSI